MKARGDCIRGLFTSAEYRYLFEELIERVEDEQHILELVDPERLIHHRIE